jgi:hypothetical protein
MDPLWSVLSYLITDIRCRVRRALDGDPQSGALSLEWLVIAVALVAAGAIAAALFDKAVKGEAKSLP